MGVRRQNWLKAVWVLGNAVLKHLDIGLSLVVLVETWCCILLKAIAILFGSASAQVRSYRFVLASVWSNATLILGVVSHCSFLF